MLLIFFSVLHSPRARLQFGGESNNYLSQPVNVVLGLETFVSSDRPHVIKLLLEDNSDFKT
jgi:hypothetical protein